jgi:DNA-3-methyladenine glycosylase II
MDKTISVTPPYNFDRVLERLALDPLNAVNKEERLIEFPYYHSDGQGEVITVQAIGTVDDPQFRITFEAHVDNDLKEKRIREVFHWDKPLGEIHDHFLTTALHSIFSEHIGTPLVLEFDPFASLVKSIIHQQLNLSFAHTLTERFVQKYGWNHNGVWFYPRPKTVAKIKVEDLRELQFSQRKAEYVIGIAEKIQSGELNLTSLETESDETIINKLTKIRGIGPWTAENYLLSALGRPNLFPKADIGIQNAVKKLYGMEKKPTIEELEELSAPWYPYLSYASLYLWRSIE